MIFVLKTKSKYYPEKKEKPKTKHILQYDFSNNLMHGSNPDLDTVI